MHGSDWQELTHELLQNGLRAIQLSDDLDSMIAAAPVLAAADDHVRFDVVTNTWIVPTSLAETLFERFGCRDATQEQRDEIDRRARREGFRLFLEARSAGEAYIKDYEQDRILHVKNGFVTGIEYDWIVSRRLARDNSTDWKCANSYYSVLDDAMIAVKQRG